MERTSLIFRQEPRKRIRKDKEKRERERSLRKRGGKARHLRSILLPEKPREFFGEEFSKKNQSR